MSLSISNLTVEIGGRIWAIIDGEIEARECTGFEHDGENFRIKIRGLKDSLIFNRDCFNSIVEARNEMKTRLAMCS